MKPHSIQMNNELVTMTMHFETFHFLTYLVIKVYCTFHDSIFIVNGSIILKGNKQAFRLYQNYEYVIPREILTLKVQLQNLF